MYKSQRQSYQDRPGRFTFIIGLGKPIPDTRKSTMGYEAGGASRRSYDRNLLPRTTCAQNMSPHGGAVQAGRGHSNPAGPLLRSWQYYGLNRARCPQLRVFGFIAVGLGIRILTGFLLYGFGIWFGRHRVYMASARFPPAPAERAPPNVAARGTMQSDSGRGERRVAPVLTRMKHVSGPSNRADALGHSTLIWYGPLFDFYDMAGGCDLPHLGSQGEQRKST